MGTATTHTINPFGDAKFHTLKSAFRNVQCSQWDLKAMDLMSVLILKNMKFLKNTGFIST